MHPYCLQSHSAPPLGWSLASLPSKYQVSPQTVETVFRKYLGIKIVLIDKYEWMTHPALVIFLFEWLSPAGYNMKCGPAPDHKFSLFRLRTCWSSWWAKIILFHRPKSCQDSWLKSKTRPSKQCGFCKYLLDNPFISHSRQSGSNGQSGPGGPGGPQGPGGPGGPSGPGGSEGQGG